MTLRLAGMAKESWWEFDGYAVSRNMPPLGELPMDRFCSFVRWYALREAEQKDRDKFETRLWRPPPNTKVIPKESPWAPENENAAFAGLKAALSGKAT